MERARDLRGRYIQVGKEPLWHHVLIYNDGAVYDLARINARMDGIGLPDVIRSIVRENSPQALCEAFAAIQDSDICRPFLELRDKARRRDLKRTTIRFNRSDMLLIHAACDFMHLSAGLFIWLVMAWYVHLNSVSDSRTDCH